MRRRYVASTSLRRHVPAGNLAPLGPPQYSKPCPPPPPPPQYSKPSYAYDLFWQNSMDKPFVTFHHTHTPEKKTAIRGNGKSPDRRQHGPE